ncbi:MAG TPA: glycosyltransferase family 4 protein [Terriglobales bacterium]|nr:glycosyltransferase family 4 protein [Terriglobales bacterium]
MRIAQVAPLYESVPPKRYGGTERVVSSLTEELVAQGHDVALYASGDSITSARLVAICPESLRLAPDSKDHIAHHILMLDQVFNDKDSFDIIHFHIDYLHYLLSRRYGITHVTTLHGRLDIPDLQPLYRNFYDMPVISISNAQRAPLPWVNWQGTVYHGLPLNRFTPHAEQGKYLAFLGRVSPEKGLDHAIEIAKRAGMPLKIAAKVDRADEEFFDTIIKPLLNHPLIEFIGEVGYPEKNNFLANAYALLFPIDWPEPFGLVMIEAMGSGTPVIAYPRGSVPEVMEDGITGFIVPSINAAVEALANVPQLDRLAIRERFEQRFSARRMTQDYVAIYERLVGEESRALTLTEGLSVGRGNDSTILHSDEVGAS